MSTAEVTIDESEEYQEWLKDHQPFNKTSSKEALSSTVVREQSASLATGDFITDYVAYADVIEAPREAHEAVAIQLLATAMNPNVRIKHGAIEIPLDVWMLILSGSGMGRNTLVALSKPVLKEANLSLVREDTWGSKPAFFQSIAEQPPGLFIWPELSYVMKMLSDNRFGGVKEWLTDRYDNWDIPHSVTYRKSGKKGDTPPIVFNQPPRINLLATSSLDWFTGSLSQEDTTGGFIPRWMIMLLDGQKRLIPRPKETDKRFIKPLATHLREVSKLSGEADLTETYEMYDDWYRNADGRFSRQPNSGLAEPFFHRHRNHVLKLAVIYEVSRSLSLRVSPAAMGRAFALAARIEKGIFALLPTGMSREGAEVDKIAEVIRSAGAKGISQTHLTQAFQGTRGFERKGRIDTLKEAGIVREYSERTQGRPALVYVHKDHWDEYEENLPEKEKA